MAGTGCLLDNYQFAGLYADATGEDGNYSAARRRYNDTYYRWLSPDPDNAGAEITDSQSWDMYSYVGDNPATRTDPGEQQSPDRAHEAHGVLRAVSSLDREVGKVLAELEASGQLENTVVVYTGDHGLNTGQHGMWEKGNGTIPQNFFDESILVSCTLCWPAGGIRQNAVCNDFVNHCDLWATLLEIAGASPDEKTAARINSPGRSYLAQLHGGEAQDWRKTIISKYGNARMARTGRYKLIRRYPYGGVRFQDELYDLKEDPRETVNRFQDTSLSKVVDELTEEIGRFFKQYTVPGHSGLDLAHEWECTPASPWIAAARLRKQKRMPEALKRLLDSS